MQDKRNIENVVQEIMRMVDEYVNAEIDYRVALKIDVGVRSAEKSSYEAESLLESKLRELVGNSFSVREPLSDGIIKMIDDSTHFHESVDWPIRFARAIERAHNITKDS